MPIATPAACARGAPGPVVTRTSRVAQSFGKKGKGLDPLTLSDSKTSCNAAVTPAARAGGRAGRQPRGTGRDRAADAGRVRTRSVHSCRDPGALPKMVRGRLALTPTLRHPKLREIPQLHPGAGTTNLPEKKGHRRLSWRRRGAPMDPATAAAAPLPSTGPLPRRTRHGRQSRCGWGARQAPRGPPLPRDSRGCHTFPSLSTAQTTMRLL